MSGHCGKLDTYACFIKGLARAIVSRAYVQQILEVCFYVGNIGRLLGIFPRGGVLPYMGYIGTCRGIGYGF